MRLSMKEKAGLADTSKIFEGLHLSEDFIMNMADEKKRLTLEKEFIEKGERHFRVCDKCRGEFEGLRMEPREQDLPF